LEIQLMAIALIRPLHILASSALLTALTVATAEAAVVRRSFELTAPAAYMGTGFVDYDDANLLPTGDPSGHLYADILAVGFAYTGQAPASISDPFKRVNFDSASTFLGIDLEIPDSQDPLQTILIANEDAYIPSSSSAVTSGVVSYGAAVPVPTPALLPGLVMVGWRAIRRRAQGNG
jgi:hypothetical protein